MAQLQSIEGRELNWIVQLFTVQLYIAFLTSNSQAIKRRNCAFYDKRIKLCMFVGLHEVNNFGHRGMAKKSCNGN